MSYILDALRKADAQRERDSSRGIHAHPMPPGTTGSGGGARAPWLWSAAAIAVALVAAGAWYFSRDRQAAPATPPVATTAASVAAAPVTPVAATSEAPQVANAIAPPPPAPAPERREPVAPRQGGMLLPPQAQMTAQVPAAPAPAPASATSAAPAPATTGLPADAPRVAISGGVYSPSPAQRMLIVNGQVFNEGSEVAPGVTVDEIRQRTAVLKFRGARYTVAY